MGEEAEHNIEMNERALYDPLTHDLPYYEEEKECGCDSDCNTDPRTLFVCPCECHGE